MDELKKNKKITWPKNRGDSELTDTEEDTKGEEEKNLDLFDYKRPSTDEPLKKKRPSCC